MKPESKKIKPGYVFQISSGGTCTVIEYKSSKHVVIEHLDKHLHRQIVSSSQIRSGKIKNPYSPVVFGTGYFGVGPHRASIGGSVTHCYTSWHNMMRRSYCPKFKSDHPSYDECSVCEEWHDFQCFAEWYLCQPRNSEKGFELDKDLMKVGSKIYSPHTCSIIPKSINTLLVDCGSKRGELPQGVSFSKEKNLYLAQLKVDGKTVYLGRHADPSAARNVYVMEKRNNIIRMAEKYKPLLHPKVYENLKNWNLD